MPTHAYERIKRPDNRFLLLRQSAKSFGPRCKKAFVQLYTMSGAYIDANPHVTKELKDFYWEEEVENLYLIEPCQFVFVVGKTSYFKRGKMSGEGTTRYYRPGFSVPPLIKPALRAFAYAVAEGKVPLKVEMKLIADIDRLDDEIGPNIDSLIEGALFYIDRYVIPEINIFRRDHLMEDLRDKLETLVLSTRFARFKS